MSRGEVLLKLCHLSAAQERITAARAVATVVVARALESPREEVLEMIVGA